MINGIFGCTALQLVTLSSSLEGFIVFLPAGKGAFYVIFAPRRVYEVGLEGL